MSISSTNNTLLDVSNKESLKKREVLFSSAKIGNNFVKTTSSISKRESSNTSDSLHCTSTVNKDVITTNELIPRNLRAIAQKMIDFLEHYYEAEELTDILGSSELINTLYEKRDIDLIDTSDEKIVSWFYEFANSLPPKNNAKIDTRTLIKNSKTIFQEKGSENSIKLFFSLFFGEEAEVYYPWEDVMIASYGNWDDSERSRIALDDGTSELKGFSLNTGHFKNNDNFIDDVTFLQDSFYYQRFSYDIRTKIKNESWSSYFRTLLHPSGFIGFATLLLSLIADENRFSNGIMSREQLDLLFILLPRLIQASNEQDKSLEYILYIINKITLESKQTQGYNKTFKNLTFSNGASISEYSDIPLTDLSSNTHKFNTTSFITSSPL